MEEKWQNRLGMLLHGLLHGLDGLGGFSELGRLPTWAASRLGSDVWHGQCSAWVAPPHLAPRLGWLGQILKA